MASYDTSALAVYRRWQCMDACIDRRDRKEEHSWGPSDETYHSKMIVLLHSGFKVAT
jgi:hypothetical protein